MLNRTNVYYATCVTLASIILYLLCIRFRLIFSYSLDLDGAEFFFVNFVQLIEQGKSLYRNPLEFPFMGVQHAPVYPYLLYSISKVLKFDLINDIHNMLVVGRFLAWISMFVNLYFISKIFRRLELPFFYSLVGATFYLLLITGHFFATRPDGMKATLFTIFLFNTIEYMFYSGSKKYFIFSILSAVSMVLLKQDSIINIYISLVLLCVYLQNKKAYSLFLFFSICLLISGTVCHYVFGEYFFLNIILFNLQVVTDIANSINIWIVIFSIVRNFPLLLLAIYGSLLAIKNFKQKKIQYFIPILSLACFVVAHVTMLRPGSYLNYTFELLLLLILNAALLVKEHEDYIFKHLKVLSVFMFIYILSLFITNRIIHSYSFDSNQEANHKNAYYTSLKEREQILSITKDAVIFLPNFKYVVYYVNAPFIWGYEMHFDQVLEVFLNFKIKSKLLFISTKEYDSYFTDGRVQYIITENDKLNMDHISKYYPRYTFYKSFNKFRMYKYAS